ncbi:hypothetical protein K432DRAFT_413249 [Neofusicoccum parvum]|uniref:Uncharacterized protein n=1 Tax=Neofusicoccum parvum TaxID=310453 RepID=A0ACB5RT67_9PEZI|nr:hypothetical protein K432DRAFT_413249 [Neofusicoccum parvum]
MDDEDRERNGEVLHVLDLPQLYTRPSAQELLNTLTLLTSEPPSWEGSDTEDEDTPMAVKSARRQSISATRAQPVQINPEGLTTYLTRIIASNLRWIEDDSVKEEIWEAASIRLSERSGRTAMGAISRKFRIPAAKDGPSEDISIHEPALTADNLGLKTWASSYLLSRRLWRLAADADSLPSAKGLPPHSVLELGSGTGLVGLSAAMVLGTDVLLTDLPEIVENLDRNALANEEVLARHNGTVHTAALDWTVPSSMTLSTKAVKEADYQDSQRFRFIFVADPLYSPDHPGWLVQAISARLSRDATARVVVELPLRTAYQPQVEDFLHKMQATGLKVCNEGYETGYDDWGSQGGRKAVRCWWTVWSWKTAYAGEAHAVEHDEQSNLSFVLEKPGSVKYEDRPVPQLKSEHDVIVNVKYTGICGSDVHYWVHGRIGAFVVESPMVLGHESSGVIHSVGAAVKTLKAGDRVAMEPGIPCRRCVRCKDGNYNLCPDMAFAATPPFDGTLAKYYALPEDFCYKLPDAVSLEEGALVEPAAVGVHICRMAKVAPGESVVVFGAGPIGLLCCKVAREVFGATKVVAVDVNAERLKFAQGYAATHVFSSEKVSPEENAKRLVQEAGLGPGADVVIDASGAEVCIQTAIHVARVGGRFTQGGMGKPDIAFPIGAMCAKELHVTGSFRYSSGDYQLAVDMIASGKLSVKELISKKVTFEGAEEAFSNVKQGNGIKWLIEGPN